METLQHFYRSECNMNELFGRITWASFENYFQINGASLSVQFASIGSQVNEQPIFTVLSTHEPSYRRH